VSKAVNDSKKSIQDFDKEIQNTVDSLKDIDKQIADIQASADQEIADRFVSVTADIKEIESKDVIDIED
jgi:prefoldin subunit 5